MIGLSFWCTFWFTGKEGKVNLPDPLKNGDRRWTGPRGGEGSKLPNVAPRHVSIYCFQKIMLCESVKREGASGLTLGLEIILISLDIRRTPLEPADMRAICSYSVLSVYQYNLLCIASSKFRIKGESSSNTITSTFHADNNENMFRVHHSFKVQEETLDIS